MSPCQLHFWEWRRPAGIGQLKPAGRRRSQENPAISIIFALVLTLLPLSLQAQLPAPNAPDNPRHTQTLETGWRSIMAPSGTMDPTGFAERLFDDRAWKSVAVPHNWDSYAGYRRAKHGNTHGTAWYRKRFRLDRPLRGDERVLLFFEGVGSFATVWLNGREIGKHAGGLTTFTLDATAALAPNEENVLAVRAEHPAGIRHLPWVCGGCERAYGFSEGSQPFGIFRAVHVVIANAVRLAPFGVHVWNDRDASPARAVAHVRADVRNDHASSKKVRVVATLLSHDGQVVARTTCDATLAAEQSRTIELPDLAASSVRLWSLADPYLYMLRVEVLDGSDTVLDKTETPFGFRTISWPIGENRSRGTFLVNGSPVFLNGTCEYPHLLGGSHAFRSEQIAARVSQIRAAGFNAFRDAHHPHDLRYNAAWDDHGVAWWTQFGAHVWFDNAEFRRNFLNLLRDWVRERRNSPSLVLWGLQNESQLPEDFARECVRIIRELDPTAVDQRIVTTCNGGGGTDWDVPQNWSGTYGGDLSKYAEELVQQRLVGEYGAWRSADLWEVQTPPAQTGYSEDAYIHVLNTKVKLARTVRDRVAGHFQWLFTTHDNPGRNLGGRGEQVADGWSHLDRIGPANNKGLLTLWGEPLDMYYIYRAHHVSADAQPMVVIGKANSADRTLWKSGSVQVYTNCEAVELFDGVNGRSLGKRDRPNDDVVIRWNDAHVTSDVLHAVAYHRGRAVATDSVSLSVGTPSAAATASGDTTAPRPGNRYLYRVNCGGPEYLDAHGNTWASDEPYSPARGYGSLSWSAAWPHLPSALGSARRIFVPVENTSDDRLYQDFRYGREGLKFVFDVPAGEYEVELHFAEPWYGRGGVNAQGWRLFDVAINDRVVLKDVDLWREAGYAKAVRKIVSAASRNGKLEISFPRVASYQAVISAIAVTSKSHTAADQPAPSPQRFVEFTATHPAQQRSWLNVGDAIYANGTATILALPEALRHQKWLRPSVAEPAQLRAKFNVAADLHAAHPHGVPPAPEWQPSDSHLVVAVGGKIERWPLFRRRVAAGDWIEFTGSEAPHFVGVISERPLAPPQAIADLQIEGSSSPSAWKAAGNLTVGQRLHHDSAIALNKLPGELSDSDWLRTPAQDTLDSLRIAFTATDHVDVYIGMPADGSEKPTWLAGWIPVTQQIVLGTRTYGLWRKHFPMGTRVELDSTASAVTSDTRKSDVFTVFVRPVRPVQEYAAPERKDFGVSGTTSHVWTVEFGVGDRYGFVFRYRSEAPGNVQLRYELIDAAGQVLCTAESNAAPAHGEGFAEWRIRTCESFNAGTYQVRISLLSGEKVTFGKLTVE
jgi:beta-galactosidase